MGFEGRPVAPKFEAHAQELPKFEKLPVAPKFEAPAKELPKLEVKAPAPEKVVRRVAYRPHPMYMRGPAPVYGHGRYHGYGPFYGHGHYMYNAGPAPYRFAARSAPA